MHIAINDLSPTLRKALESVSYGGRDIQVLPAETVDSYSEGSAGTRGFVTIVNLDTGESRTVNGSWGGANIFVSSPVDRGDETIPLPPNGAAIKGTRGQRTYATVYAHPDAMGYFLPSGDEEVLSAEELQALYCYVSIKGGAYRVDELARRHVAQGTVDGLVEREYLKRNRAGAVQVTTKGKNANTVRY